MVSVCPSSVPVQFQTSYGSVPVQFLLGSGSVQVQLWFCSGPVRARSQFSSCPVMVQFLRFSSAFSDLILLRCDINCSDLPFDVFIKFSLKKPNVSCFSYKIGTKSKCRGRNQNPAFKKLPVFGPEPECPELGIFPGGFLSGKITRDS